MSQRNMNLLHSDNCNVKEQSFSSDDTVFLPLPSIPLRSSEPHSHAHADEMAGGAHCIFRQHHRNGHRDFDRDSIDDREVYSTAPSSSSSSAHDHCFDQRTRPSTMNQRHRESSNSSSCSSHAGDEEDDDCGREITPVPHHNDCDKQWSSSDEESSFYKDHTTAPCSEFDSPAVQVCREHASRAHFGCVSIPQGWYFPFYLNVSAYNFARGLK